MRNLLTLVALLVSVSGIAVSLAREEVRCYLGLESVKCLATEKSQPTQRVTESKPLEVVPPPEETSIPLEVIPPPEQ
jgi:hypothetical protein